MLAVELSSHQLHWSQLAGPALGRRAQPAARPPRVARLLRRPTADAKAKIYAGVAGQLRLQRRRPGHRADGGGGRGGRGGPGDRLHPGHPGSVHARRGRRPAGRPGVHRAAPRLRARAGQDQRRHARRRRTTWPTRWPRPRWPARTACRPTAVRDGLRHGHARCAQDPDRRRASAASAGSTTPRPPTRTRPTPPCGPSARPVDAGRQGRLDRRRPGQGHHLRRTGDRRTGTGCAARCCSAWTGG